MNSSFFAFTATQKRGKTSETKEDVGGESLNDGREEGEAENVMLPSQPITVLAVLVATTHSYIFNGGVVKLQPRVGPCIKPRVWPRVGPRSNAEG